MSTKLSQAFKKIEIEDISWAKPILAESGYMGSEYNFTSSFNWAEVFGIELARFDDFVLTRMVKGKTSYLFPAGAGDPTEAFEEVLATALEENGRLLLHSVPKSAMEFLEENYAGRFTAFETRQYFDYIYSAQKLASLAGKKLHAKRNHINRFEQEYPDWSYVKLSPENLSLAREMTDRWYEESAAEKSDGILTEKAVLQRAYDNFGELGLTGGMIVVGTKPVAVTIGSPVGKNTLEVHFEKAFAHIQGSYAIVNREFIKHSGDEFEYVNREDDMGEEGLRKAKSSYNPEFLLEKFDVVFEK